MLSSSKAGGRSEKGDWQFRGKTQKKYALLACLLIVCMAVLFAHQQRTSSAGAGNSAPVALTQLQGAGVDRQTLETTARSADKLAAQPSIWPTRGEVTSRFGWRTSPWGDGQELHQGIDIANVLGTPVVATADGVVVQSGWSGGYGNLVQVDHANGLVSFYGHNSRLAVQPGQPVKKGQVIAYMGSTGRSTGTHLHYEIRRHGEAIDPISFLVQ